jgi:hypothetical protein
MDGKRTDITAGDIDGDKSWTKEMSHFESVLNNERMLARNTWTSIDRQKMSSAAFKQSRD